MGQHQTHSSILKKGFTIVELVVVIVVIGILAALTVIGYGVWRSSVAQGEVQSDLNGVSSGMESALTWSSADGYPEYADGTIFSEENGTDSIFRSSDNVTLTYAWGDSTSYCVQAVSTAKPDVIYFFSVASGQKTSGTGACPPEVNSGTVSNVVPTGTLNYPTGIAVDSSHNLYVAETGNHRIVKITQAGVVTVLAGGTQGNQEGTGTGARFNTPYGVAVSSSGDVYVVDYGNDRIRKVTPGGTMTTFAGSTQGSNNGNGTSAQFWDPYAIVFDPSTGNAYITETGNHRVRRITPDREVTTLAGNGSGNVDATGTAARFSDPIGIGVNSSGNLFVVENGNDKVRKVTTAGVVTSIAGGTSGFADGTGTAARFNNPTGIGIKGNVAYIADSVNNRVRAVNIQTGVVITLAGSGAAGSNNATGTAATFDNPTGIAVGTDGTVYIVESNAGRIRKIQ